MGNFLLLIAAMAVAMAVAPFIRDQFLSLYRAAIQEWKRLYLQWTLRMGRYFISKAKLLNQSSDGVKQLSDGSTLVMLTPVRDVDNIEIYENELKAKIDHPDGRNIAITGPYGSGKSSLIKTFFDRNPEFNPLFVSLAAFKDDRKNTKGHDQAGEDKSNEVLPQTNNDFPKGAQTYEEDNSQQITQSQQKLLDDRIEYSILQQLFYHVRGKDVPFSRLKRIRTVRKSKIAGLSLLVVLFILSILFLYFPEFLPGYQIWKLELPSGHVLHYLSILILALGAGYLVYLVFKLQQNASMIKLNLDRAELEIAPDKGASVLNQHMDEIVYYFSATKHDLLVIEDLDRFKNPEIFVKLREINTLINNSMQVGRKVTFIYALRDDVFVDEGRTKFFDFILPVIPVTNAVNSASMLINMFETLNLSTPVSRNLLNDLSLFITDRRLMQNIFNEFVIYSKQLNNPSLFPDCLLAMIVYKNLHPTDFSDIQSNKGMVYDFFATKHQLIAESISQLEGDLAKLENSMAMIEKEVLQSYEELKVLYAGKYYEKLYRTADNTFSGKFYIDGKHLDFSKMLEDSNFEMFLKGKRIHFVTLSNAAIEVPFTFSQLEKEINPTQSFIGRKNDLMVKARSSKFQMGLRSNQIKDELSTTKGYSMKDILVKKNISSINTPINKHRALSYLIGNGYITEDYWLYVSYFEPGQLSRRDFAFIMAAKTKSVMSWDHRLDHPSDILERFADSEFNSQHVLNFELVEYLAQNPVKYAQKYQAIIVQLSQYQEAQWEFIEGFERKSPKTCKIVIDKLASTAPDFWVFVRSHSKDNRPLVRKYLSMVIESCSENVILSLKDIQSFKAEIEIFEQLLTVQYEHISENLKPLLKALGVRFQIPPQQINETVGELLKYVWEQGCYALNVEMVDFLLFKFLSADDLKSIQDRQLTAVLNDEIPIFSDYAKQHIEEYLRNVFLKKASHANEDAKTYSRLFSLENISADTLRSVIIGVKFELESLDDISSEFYDIIFEYGRVKPSWSNVRAYVDYNEGRADANELVNFLNNSDVAARLGQDAIGGYEQDVVDTLQSILGRILENMNVSADSKIELLNAAAGPIRLQAFNSVENEVLERLVQKKLISHDKKTLSILLKYLDSAFAKLTIDSWDSIAPLLEELDLTIDQYSRLLSTNGWREDQITGIYLSMTKDKLYKMLIQGKSIPSQIFRDPKFSFDAEELVSFAGKVVVPDNVISILEGNIGSLSEPIVSTLLYPLGGEFAKVAQKQGKSLPKTSQLIRLLTLLAQNKLLVDSFEEKVKEVHIKYISVT